MNNGLITKIWGPHLWFSLNSIVFGYPIKPTLEQKHQYMTFFKSLGWVLPCSHCRESYNFFINDGETKLTIEKLNSRDDLIKWIYNIHNRVNKKLNYLYLTSLDEFKEKFESFRYDENSKINSYQIYEESLIEVNYIPLKIAKYFIEYAKSKNISFDKIEYYNDLIHNKRNINKKEYQERNLKCYNQIKKIRTEKIQSINIKDGYLSNEELKLISMLCTTLPLNELIKAARKLGFKIEKKYILI